ncbi:MAG TPA: DUF4331 domain-containing protein [Candidatus Binatia bacterium]|nr:DUF4331 domain-containing protein [Candidatus Binatia bacterium]
MRPIRRSLAVLLLAAGASTALASSHREAPLISQDPNADNTDVYAFVSPDRPDTVTFVANYIPLEEPAGGPTFTAFGDDVLYAINVDNDGDGEEDVSYRFRFRTTIRNEDSFLYNTGPITSLDDPAWNMPQTYTVTRVERGTGAVIGRDLATPPVNVGPRSTPNYETLAAAAVHELPGGIRVFAGQRDDPFFVDLGSVFDLAGLRPFNGAHLLPLAPGPGVDGVGGYNTHTIALQVPIAQLTRRHRTPSGPDDPEAVIGVYASASRRKVRILRGDGSIQNEAPWVQVSRLAEPLINELIIPLGKKDFWNRSDPAEDEQFASFYRTPEIATLVNVLYPTLPDTRTTGRDDLVLILLTGVPLPGGHNLNFTGNTKADLLRLNMAIAPTHPVGQGDPLGVLNGDLAGFPNGRRLEDDVVDVELRAVADGYGSLLSSLFGLPNNTPNNQVGDGVNANDLPFLAHFPYVATPHQGYEHTHHAVGSTSTPHLN